MLASRQRRIGELPDGLVGATGPSEPRGGTIEHMFVAPPLIGRCPRPRALPGRSWTASGTGESLALLAERTRPVSSSQTRLLPVVPPLAGLFPDGSLRRGSTIVVTRTGPGPGVDRAAGGGGSAWHWPSWPRRREPARGARWSGWTGLGAVAAHDVGIDLARLAVVPRPDAAWAEVTAALIDGVDLVVLCPPFPPRPAMARRLVARARERRSVLVVVPGGPDGPSPPTCSLSVAARTGTASGPARGYLRRRRMTVTATGRRSAARPRHRQLWLPSADRGRGRRPTRRDPVVTGMNRLLVVRCPDLLDEDEGGAALRLFVRVIEAVEAYCPWVTAVRPGICSLPARGPARYFGGEGPLVRPVTEAASASPRRGRRGRRAVRRGARRPRRPRRPRRGDPGLPGPLPGGRPRPARTDRTAGPVGHPHPG